jgi:hypothetical protein
VGEGNWGRDIVFCGELGRDLSEGNGCISLGAELFVCPFAN